MAFWALEASRANPILRFEVDMDALWTVSRRPHEGEDGAPGALSSATPEVLRRLPRGGDGDHVFINPRTRKPLSPMFAAAALEAAAGDGKDPPPSTASAPASGTGPARRQRPDLAQLPLAHARPAVEKAYAHSDLLKRRAELMEPGRTF